MTVCKLALSSDLCNFWIRIWKHILLSLIDIRHQSFTEKICLVTGLTSTNDELIQCVKRTDSQDVIFQHLLRGMIAVPDLIGNDWVQLGSGSDLSIQCKTVAIAPVELLEHLYLSSRKSHFSPILNCRCRNLKCGPLCKCEGCEMTMRLLSER